MRAWLNHFNNLSNKKKLQFIIALALTVTFFVSLPVYAWFSSQKKTATIVKINAPTVLSIGSGGKDESSDMIDLADINVEELNSNGTLITEGDYLFSVHGKYINSYDIQISRTTNIPFTYELYRVSAVPNISESLSNGWGTTDENQLSTLENSGYAVAVYESKVDYQNYYYPYSLITVENEESNDYKLVGRITGEYKNSKSLDGEMIAKQYNDSNTLHERSYTTYNYVNKYAEPLYWQALDLPVNPAGQEDSEFLDYYVLKIKWDASFKNTKETDMIYITAKRNS